MGLLALSLVLTAAVLHASWNLAAKQVSADAVAFVWLYVVGSVVLWLPIAVVWMVLADERPAWSWVYAGLLSAALHIVYQLVLQGGYQRADLTLVYPVARGTGPLLTFVVAVSVLGERPGTVATAGVLAVVVGVLTISLGTRTGRLRAGVAWGAATGLTIAAYTLWDDRAVTDLKVPPVPYFVVGLLLQLPVLTLLLRRRRCQLGQVWRETRRSVLAVALLSPLAYILVLRAMQLAPVSLVAAARESSIVVGALLGWWVLDEPTPGRRVIGATVVLAGIVALVVR